MTDLLPAVGALVAAVGGVVGLIYAALRFQREDAGAVVTQSKDILAAMRDLNDELAAALEACRADRLRLEAELGAALKAREEEITRLRAKAASLQEKLEAQDDG